ncbi:hypothetical protein AMS62_29380, partial [Bacillus sp. FJAT-18019]
MFREGDLQLVGYVVGDLSRAELRAYLKTQLPEYMIPAYLVELETLPLTPNGKVDTRALPDPEVESEASYVAPRTLDEQQVAEIFSEVLGVKQVGVHDSFFDLGGHSLLATQAVSRLREAFQSELPLRELFESPTVEALALRVNEWQRKNQGEALPPLLPVSRKEDIPLSYAQQRLWFIDRLEPGSALYNIPFALRLCGDWKMEHLEQGLKELIRRHEILRTTIGEHEGVPVQKIHPMQKIQEEELRIWNWTDLRNQTPEDREAERERLQKEAEQQPFDLETGPLLRIQAIRMSEQEWVVLGTMHHIIADGWSIGVFMREWMHLYEGLVQGLPAELEPLAVQYADFASWQRSWLK